MNFYKLHFIVYVYSLEGELLRIEPLYDQLSLCSKTFQDGHKYREFQTSYVNDCEIDLTNFFRKQNNTLEFYEIFMRNLENPDDLIDVPVLIDNIKNPLFPGQLNNETNIENAILVRRFFLIDNISGYQGEGNFLYGKNKNNTHSVFSVQENLEIKPLAIRYPAKIKIIITLRSVRGESKIYPPYIEIFYKSKLTSSLDKSQITLISFRMDYNMDLTRFNNIMLGILIAFSVLVLIAATIKFNVWLNTHPKIYDVVSFSLLFSPCIW